MPSDAKSAATNIIVPGITLVSEAERLIYTSGRAKIFYRRVPSLKRALGVKRHTKRGQTDYSAVAAELLVWAILGWEGVDDGKNDVPFAPELIASLPEDVRGDLMTLTGAATTEDGEALGAGNS